MLMTRTRNENGMGLIDVLAGITLFSVVAAGLAATTVTTIRANSTSNTVTAAAALVHDKIEQFRALDPAANPPDLTPGYHADPNNPLTALGDTGGKFVRSWVVMADTPTLAVSEVVVTVAWEVPTPSSLTGATYVCQTDTCS